MPTITFSAILIIGSSAQGALPPVSSVADERATIGMSMADSSHSELSTFRGVFEAGRLVNRIEFADWIDGRKKRCSVAGRSPSW